MPPCKVHVPKAKPPHGLVVLGTSALHMRNLQSVGFHRGFHPVREVVRPRSLQSIGTWLLDFSRWLEGGGTTASPRRGVSCADGCSVRADQRSVKLVSS